MVPAVRQQHFMAAIRGKYNGWRWAKSMSNSVFDARELDAFLSDQESELYEEQKKSGFDLSWRLYFMATGR